MKKRFHIYDNVLWYYNGRKLSGRFLESYGDFCLIEFFDGELFQHVHMRVPAKDLRIVADLLVWNGKKQWHYNANDDGRSSQITSDKMLIPIHEKIAYCVNNGCDVIVIMSCAKGKPAGYDKSGSFFETSCDTVLSKFSEITFKDFITEVNKQLYMKSNRQKCEVICKEKHLSYFVDHHTFSIKAHRVNKDNELIPTSINVAPHKSKANQNKHNDRAVIVITEDYCRNPDSMYANYPVFKFSP
jgi:hypothetical protein